MHKHDHLNYRYKTGHGMFRVRVSVKGRAGHGMAERGRGRTGQGKAGQGRAN